MSIKVFASSFAQRADKLIYTNEEMDQFYALAVKSKNDSISIEELIMVLRGGDIQDWVRAFGIIISIITVLNNVDGFQVPPGTIVPPHLKYLYGTQKPENHFGYEKGGATNSESERNWIQNAYSEIPWHKSQNNHGPDFGLDPTKPSRFR